MTRTAGSRASAHVTSTVDGRLLVVAAVAVYGAAIAIAELAWGVDLWRFLGVKSAPSLFFDARNVAAAADCWAQGHDPLVSNPCDPWGRVMVYPRVWVLLHYVGLTQDRTLLFGAILVAAFLVSLLLLVGRLSLREGGLVAATVVSPAVMLSVERGNVDLVLFAILVAAVFAWQARAKITPFVTPALILVAAIAKFYAIFALPALAFTNDRRWRRVIVAALVGMLVYLVVIFDDVRQVLTAPEGGLLYSYGARILIGDLYHTFVPETWGLGSLLAQAIAVTPLIVLTVLVWVRARRRLGPPSSDEIDDPRTLAFHVGALIYLGTFALRKNGDYRLVFVLLTLPLLLNWTGHVDPVRRGLAKAGIVIVIVGLWVGALSPFIGPWDELGSWAMAGVFVALLAATVPPVREVLAWRRSAQGSVS
jgi:hypothetical protein